LRALFEAFPTGDRGDGMGALGTYIIAIDGYSLAAIQKAVMRLIRGEVAGVDERFLPTPAQLSKAVRYCEDLLAPVAPRKALPAPGDILPTEDSKARVKDMANFPSVASPYDEYDAWVNAKATIKAPEPRFPPEHKERGRAA
jgi:hypothetical protein